MECVKLNFSGLKNTLIFGLSELSADLGFDITPDGTSVVFEITGNGISLSWDGEHVNVKIGAPHMAARAVSLLVEQLKNKKELSPVQETPIYDTLGVMPDCSRNAVMTVDTFKKFTRKLALMGYSMIQLYTEDTYEIKEYPYFGYMRGQYTADDLREMDEYAAGFGIELVPCIQTLAHLNTALRWDAFAPMLDIDDILLVDEEKTYELIECMFRTMSGALRSRRINIGFDEAFAVGLGKFLDRHGYQNRTGILLRHLDRVMEIARRYGYRPMMWSDMFFRLANGGEYYITDKPLDTKIMDKIPSDVDLVYWDYYNDNFTLVSGMMAQHNKITDKLVFAGGAWKWSGFAPDSYYSEHLAKVHHAACVENQVREVFLTAWGDNGSYASLFSILPALTQWAELCYTGKDDQPTLSKRFKTCTGADYEDFMQLSLTINTPDNPRPGVDSINASLYVLWQDILCGLLDKNLLPEYREHYEKSEEVLADASERAGEWAYLFDTQRAYCHLLALKTNLGIDLHRAYHAEDRTALRKIAEQIIPELHTRIKAFYEAEKHQWMAENRVFGLDSFDLRIGGLLQRADTAASRILDYLEGRVERLEEVEAEQLPFRSNAENHLVRNYNRWAPVVTASIL